MITTVKFAKCHPDAKIPTKRFEDAGWDLYPIIPDEEGITIYPHETIIAKTGLKSALDPAFFMKITERSSMGARGIGDRALILPVQEVEIEELTEEELDKSPSERQDGGYGSTDR